MFTPAVGYSGPPSAVIDESVTKSIEFVKVLSRRIFPNTAINSRPFIQYLVHLHRDFGKDKGSTMNLPNSTMKKKKNPVPIVDVR